LQKNGDDEVFLTRFVKCFLIINVVYFGADIQMRKIGCGFEEFTEKKPDLFNFVDVCDWVFYSDFHLLLVSFDFGGLDFALLVLFN
jgi:hypothetical protein